jgi:hypothetical protein
MHSVTGDLSSKRSQQKTHGFEGNIDCQLDHLSLVGRLLSRCGFTLTLSIGVAMKRGFLYQTRIIPVTMLINFFIERSTFACAEIGNSD